MSAELTARRISAWITENHNCGEGFNTPAEIQAMHIMEEALALISAQSEQIKSHRDGRLLALEQLSAMKSNCLFFCCHH